jgi:hypothetical protein
VIGKIAKLYGEGEYKDRNGNYLSSAVIELEDGNAFLHNLENVMVMSVNLTQVYELMRGALGVVMKESFTIARSYGVEFEDVVNVGICVLQQQTNLLRATAPNSTPL